MFNHAVITIVNSETLDPDIREQVFSFFGHALMKQPDDYEGIILMEKEVAEEPVFLSYLDEFRNLLRARYGTTLDVKLELSYK